MWTAMPELGFRDRSSSSSSSSAMTTATRRSSLRARDASPDSVIFTLESNLSFFSSASASVDRCSFASDAHDHDSLVSEISLHLGAHDSEVQESSTSSGPDPDPNKHGVHINRQRKGEKVKVQKEESDVDAAIDSARSSFSLAIKECQERRSRSEAVSKKLDRRRPASLDLNNVTASSPRLGTIKKAPLTSRKSGNFPSPGTPNYRHGGMAMQKGWSSERVPAHSGAGKKNVNASLLPFNSGKTLPSKWEDAERWIFSPVSGDNTMRSASYQHQQRKPKSKSGPLGPPGIAYYSLYSPAVPMFEGGNGGNFMAASPFSASVMASDGLVNSHGGAFPGRSEPCMARSVSVHGCSEMLSMSSSMPASEVRYTDERINGVKDAATNVSRTVSRRDMATQMSPEGSPNSSPKMGLSFSDATPIVDLGTSNSCRLEVRDVQIDEQVTMTRWSKKHRPRIPGKASEIFESWKKKDSNARSPAWDLADTAKSLSMVKREEAKITAWENLQKAKAEAAIRKLEMKLEKKRSSSMEKIMKKLRSAQKRAQEMRSSMISSQTNQVVRSSSQKAVSFHTTRQTSSLSGCFTCHAF